MPGTRLHQRIVLLIIILTWAASSGQADDLDTVRYLDEREKATVREINLARTDPKAYAAFIEEWIPFYEGKLRTLPDRVAIRTKEGLRAVREAVRFLENCEPLPPLTPSPGLSMGARDHARDLGPRGATGHRGLDGSRPGDRVNRYGEWKRRVAENIAYGGDAPREVVMRLIIDDGVRGRGHRENIFHHNYRVIGVAFAPHDKYGRICVITFADDYVD
ncbi:MAG: CAP domain-containing protein [Candidatus Krumholzibacteria bacterium]|nr:CAP domain-containing protein [Candidatus Krumholzibacteria bacterium]